MKASGPDAFKWIYPEALGGFQTLADQMSQMSDRRLIVEAAHAAGVVVQTTMRDLIYGQPVLDAYQDVAEGIQVFEDGSNVFVGIPQGAAGNLTDRAIEMDAIFPVKEVAFDQAVQTGGAGTAFEQYLIDHVF